MSPAKTKMNFYLDSNYIVFNMTAGADPFAMGSVPVVPAPVSGTTAPVTSTATPVVCTTAPVSTTTAPVAATTAPVADTTAAVADTTAAVADTTAAVADTSAALADAAAPGVDTTAPGAGTTAPGAALPASSERPTVEKSVVSKVENKSQPTIAAMVLSAIKELKEKNGSSLQAIKKYLAANYKIDSAKSAPFIGRFLRRAVVKGTLDRTKGSGALGRFKLPVVDNAQEMVKAVVAKKKKKRVKTAGVPKKK